jgi:hypothetical protein
MLLMNQFEWIIGCRFQCFVRREYDWVLRLTNDVNIGISCLWRLLESDRIRFTSEDEGHQFGLPAPIDAAREVNHRLMGAVVNGVQLRPKLLDCEIQFSTGHIFQIIPNSSGYEAWEVCHGKRRFIAIGGGELAVFDH